MHVTYLQANCSWDRRIYDKTAAHVRLTVLSLLPSRIKDYTGPQEQQVCTHCTHSLIQCAQTPSHKPEHFYIKISECGLSFKFNYAKRSCETNFVVYRMQKALVSQQHMAPTDQKGATQRLPSHKQGCFISSWKAEMLKISIYFCLTGVLCQSQHLNMTEEEVPPSLRYQWRTCPH